MVGLEDCSDISTPDISSKSRRIHGTGIFTYRYHKNQPNVGKYTIHGSCENEFSRRKMDSKPQTRNLQAKLQSEEQQADAERRGMFFSLKQDLHSKQKHQKPSAR